MSSPENHTPARVTFRTSAGSVTVAMSEEPLLNRTEPHYSFAVVTEKHSIAVDFTVLEFKLFLDALNLLFQTL